MRDNLIPVIVGRNWRIAEGYHAVEIHTATNAMLPPFDEGACITVCPDRAGREGRTYPLLPSASAANRYVVGTRLPLNERDEVFIGEPKRAPAIFDARVRSILFAGGIGAASIVGIAKRLASAGQKFELHNFARSADRAVLRDEMDALRRYGKVHHYFDLSHESFDAHSAHAMSPARADTHIYCSGPPAFMARIERQAREWVYAGNVHKIVLGA